MKKALKTYPAPERPLIGFRAPSKQHKEELEKLAEARGENLAQFCRTAVYERVKRLKSNRAVFAELPADDSDDAAVG
jgi:hypothetical protein